MKKQTNKNQIKSGEILIVDDDQTLLSVMSEMLENAGYIVRTASDGNLAMESIKSNRPSLILLDIKMPEPDGYQVCRWLKESKVTRDIPVIFLSALLDSKDKIKAFDYGGIDYIIKPFKQQEALARVAAHMNLWKAREEIKEKNFLLHKKIADCKQAEEELGKHREHLEDLVAERTQELLVMNNQLRQEIADRVKSEDERIKLIAKLQKAIAEIKNLSGLLPICASCKKIRNDKGYWEQVETYITNHSDAEFSHGFCPECMEKFYPDLI